MIFLRFQGNPGYQNGFAEDIGVIRLTVKKTTSFVLGKVVDKFKERLVFSTGRKIEGAKLEWATRIQFPAAFSTIDCTHIPS